MWPGRLGSICRRRKCMPDGNSRALMTRTRHAGSRQRRYRPSGPGGRSRRPLGMSLLLALLLRGELKGSEVIWCNVFPLGRGNLCQEVEAFIRALGPEPTAPPFLCSASAAHAACPLAIGYTLLPGKGLPPGAEQAAPAVGVGSNGSDRAGSGSNSWVAAAAKLCSQSTACVAFTTSGTLVTRLPESATWPDIEPETSRCDGVYLRSALLGEAEPQWWNGARRLVAASAMPGRRGCA